MREESEKIVFESESFPPEIMNKNLGRIVF